MNTDLTPQWDISTIFRWTWKALKGLFQLTGVIYNKFAKDKFNNGVSIPKVLLIFFIGYFLMPIITGFLPFLWLAFGFFIIKDELTRRKGAVQTNINPPAPLELVSDTPNGVIFGNKDDKYIAKPENTDGHIMVVGGVGSGKSSCIAIPTLRNWSERVFAIDIKGELYEKTKDYRQTIKVFNPQDENACGYDPYIVFKNSKNATQEARAIAQAIIPLPPETKDPFWIESAQSILTGAILHYYSDYSFIDTLKNIQSQSSQDLIKTISESGNEKARLCVNSFVCMAETTLSSVFSELSRGIVTLVTDDEIVSALTREKVITPADLEYGQDIYINIPEHLLRQWKNLLTLIVNQFLTFFEKREENNSTPILFMLDEFPRLGKIPAIVDGLATLRSKKISIALIVQSLAQLDTIYGHNERKVIADTCSYKAILSATDADTQEYFSRLVGTYDKMMTGTGEQFQAFTGISKGTSTDMREHEKRIIKPEEFATLKDIVLLSPYGFCRVDKVPYYTEN